MAARSPTGTLLLIGACAAALSACQRKPATPTAGEQPRIAQANELWRIEVVQDGKAVSQTDICADPAVRASFARPNPALNGKPCERVGNSAETGGTYSVRCHIDNQQYRVGAVTKGDTAHDFTVEMAVAPLVTKGPTFEQVRHYRLMGACPSGWQIADAATPGSAQVSNTLSGAVRTASAPAP